MPGRVRSVPFRQRSRRQTDWGFGPDIIAQTLSSSAKLLGTTSLGITEVQMLIRIRGMMHLVLETSGGVGNGFIGASGIALVNSDAFGVGITAIPGPFTDAHWDNWIWHTFFDVRSITATIADGVNAGVCHVRIPVDSKAMRKWDPAETLVWMTEVSESGAATLKVNADSRILLKAA